MRLRRPRTQKEDFIDVTFNMRPLDLQLLQDDGETVSYEAVRSDTANPGAPVFALAVSAPSPATPVDRERLEQLLRELKADFHLVAPIEENLRDVPGEDPSAGLDEGSRLSFEAQLRTVNRECLGPAGVDLLIAVDPPIDNGEIDTWKAIGGIVRIAKIKVTAGRAELRSSTDSSAASAVNDTATLKAKTLRVVGRRTGAATPSSASSPWSSRTQPAASIDPTPAGKAGGGWNGACLRV